MSGRRWIDPAEGWRWGFPRIYDEAIETLSVTDWLRSFGVPDFNMEYCRSWYAKEDE